MFLFIIIVSRSPGVGVHSVRRVPPAGRARALAERLRDSWQHLVRDRATRALTYNDEQFHVLERITVAEAGRRARALLQRAAPLAAARADAVADW